MARLHRRERGQATAELAVLLPAVVALLLVLLGAGAAVVTQVRVADAARSGARAVVAGESSDRVRQIVVDLAGPQARVTVRDGDVVEVHVDRPLPGVIGSWGLRAQGRARVPAEPAPVGGIP